MPIYEYHCECGLGGEVNLPLRDFGQPQKCDCGKTMRLKMSVSSFVMKPTGRGMALDTLNSNVVGGRRKAWAENAAAQGL